MKAKLMKEYPDRDLTPEHTKRDLVNHPDILLAYDYIESILDTSDYDEPYAWHGWALREAFLAGMSAEKEKSGVKNES